MPAIKHQIIRFRIINNCLTHRRKKHWLTQELLDEMNKEDIKIGIRRLRDDIHLMKECTQLKYYAPIESKKGLGYYYTDPHYSIDHFPLTESDIKNLEIAASTLLQYQGVSIFNDFAGTVGKVTTFVNHIKSTNYEPAFSFIDFEKSPYYHGIEHLDNLIDAIKNKCVIELTYKKFDSDQPKTHTISPYLLKEYRNRWYILGLNHKHNKIITFGLDRMLNISFNHQASYIANTKFSTEDFFKHTIGITTSNEPAEVVILSFTESQGKYIKTQPLHITQKILIDNNEELRVKLKVILNPELESIILSYGPKVKVISPTILKQKIADSIADTYSYYHS